METGPNDPVKERAFAGRVLKSLIDLFRHTPELVGFVIVESDLHHPLVWIIARRKDVCRPVYDRVLHWPSQVSSVVVVGASHSIFFFSSLAASLKTSACSFIWWRIRAGKDSWSTSQIVH